MPPTTAPVLPQPVTPHPRATPTFSTYTPHAWGRAAAGLPGDGAALALSTYTPHAWATRAFSTCPPRPGPLSNLPKNWRYATRCDIYAAAGDIPPIPNR